MILLLIFAGLFLTASFSSTLDCVNDGYIRLESGNETAGTVEVCSDGLWRLVCDDRWDVKDATVVCRQLGFSSKNAVATTGNEFSTNKRGQKVLLGNVMCNGDESQLLDCQRDDMLGCGRLEAAGVICLECDNEDIRLVGGNDTAGTVEVCFNDTWQLVCDDAWGSRDAKVVCRQLGFSPNDAAQTSGGHFNTSNLPILLDQVNCDGDESHLLDCPSQFGVSNCAIFESAGVICQVLPSQIILTLPFPGEFINVSTQPNCLGGTEALICDRNDTILSDGNLGFDLVPSKFLAWISNSRITIRCGTERCVTAMGLYYYHDPVKEVGLPDFCLSTSQYQSQLGNRLSHVIFWNPTASMTDDTPGVRNVTVVITGPVKENMRYFHIGFMVIGNIHQFAISELYTYNTDVTINVDGPFLELSSEPLNGPDILLPANKTVIMSSTSIKLVCRVVTQGYFEWQWTPQSYSAEVSTDTRTSTIEIPLDVKNVGTYTCTASFYPVPVSGNFTLDIEVLLFADNDHIQVNLSHSEGVTLSCTLAGYIDTSEFVINWTFKERLLVVGHKYNISVSIKELPHYGRCGVGYLEIMDFTIQDLGDYKCSYESLSQTITVTDAGGTDLPPSVTPSEDSSNNLLLLPVLGGCVLAMLLLITIGITISILCFLYVKWRKLASISIPREEAIYECVRPIEKMEMKENDAYGYLHTDDSRYETISPQSTPSTAHERVQPF